MRSRYRESFPIRIWFSWVRKSARRREDLPFACFKMVEESLLCRLRSAGDEMLNDQSVFSHALLEAGTMQRGNPQYDESDFISQLLHRRQNLEVPQK